jgi:hypothetical protein
MPAIVSADGGQTGLIHACLLPDAGTGPNIVIIGADETCPPGTPSLHWAVGVRELTLDSTFESPEILPVTEVPVRPPPKVNKKLYKPLGIQLSKRKVVTETLGPSPSIEKELTVSCPGSHPFVLSGTSSVVEPGYRPGKPILSSSVGLHAWHAVHQAWQWKCLFPTQQACFGGWHKSPVMWTLKVSVLCAKADLVKQLGTVKAGG